MHSPTKITVVLVEDHAIVRQGLCSLLNADGGFKIVGEARTGREAVELMRKKRPDVIVMDIAMPILNGIEATRQILAIDPNARILILSAHNDDEYIERMTASGAAGFLEKQTSAEVLTKAIREVAAGRNFFGGDVEKHRQHLMDKLNIHQTAGLTRYAIAAGVIENRVHLTII